MVGTGDMPMPQQIVVLQKIFFPPEPEERLEVQCSQIHEVPAEWQSRSRADGEVEQYIAKPQRVVLVDADWRQVSAFGMPTHLTVPVSHHAPERMFEVLSRAREWSGAISFEVLSPWTGTARLLSV
jgi:hypothetical protein